MLFCYGLLARFAPALGGWRAGLWAGLAYAVNPLGYRALAYGILPTILAQWLTPGLFHRCCWSGLAAFLRERAGSRGAARRSGHLAAGAAAPAAPAALVAFPTIAVFNTLVIGRLALVWLRGRLPAAGLGGGRAARRRPGSWRRSPITASTCAELLNKTLPAAAGARACGRAGPGATPPPSTVHWTGPLDLLGWTLGYLVSPLPLLAGLAGLALLWAQPAAGAGRPPSAPGAPAGRAHRRLDRHPAHLPASPTTAWT